MKIMICGSMAFASEMTKAKNELEERGHIVSVPYDIEQHLEHPDFVDDLSNNFHHAVETDIIRRCFDLVAQSDAILVLNLQRRNIKGYIGTSTLMEIGLAYFLKKKMFLYNDIPNWDEVRWAHEINIMHPVIINGDMSIIK